MIGDEPAMEEHVTETMTRQMEAVGMLDPAAMLTAKHQMLLQYVPEPPPAQHDQPAAPQESAAQQERRQSGVQQQEWRAAAEDLLSAPTLREAPLTESEMEAITDAVAQALACSAPQPAGQPPAPHQHQQRQLAAERLACDAAEPAEQPEPRASAPGPAAAPAAKAVEAEAAVTAASGLAKELERILHADETDLLSDRIMAFHPASGGPEVPPAPEPEPPGLAEAVAAALGHPSPRASASASRRVGRRLPAARLGPHLR